MTVRRLQLLFLLALCAALYVGSRYAVRITPVHPGLEARIEGDFTEGGGWYPGEPFVTAQPVRAWGSWSGGDEKTGTLQLGPFPAPLRLRIAVGGYPGGSDEIQITAVRVTDGARVRLKLADVGERWRITEHDLPADWRDQPMTIEAIDRAKGIGGWVSLTEPIHGGRGAGPAGLLETLAAWSINGGLLGMLWLAAVRLVRRTGRVAETWIPLAGVAVMAAGGYLLFWAYFAHSMLGQVLSWILVATGPVILFLTRQAKAGDERRAEPGDERRVAGLAITIGLLYLAILHVFPASLDFYSLAANRFRPDLPSDNQLPFETAERLVAGVPLRQADSNWISSDRPPLQCGWELITWPVFAKLDVDPRAASGTAAVWFQLSWVVAAFGMLRALGVSARRTAGWVAVMGLAGFFLQNTTFTWPKLSAAAFACAAFILWTRIRPATQRRDDVVVGAGFAALAWLSHGGVAFSYLALAPWLLWRFCRGEARLWLLGALVFGLFAAPWIAYQKFYDPPGNRLLKWHLGGQVPKDSRGTMETIRDSYRALSWAEIWGHKRLNLETQIRGEWSGVLTVSPSTAVLRRNQEFFFTARALTWWPLALLLLPFAWRRQSHRRERPATRRLQIGLLVWTLATLFIWCGLMFAGGSAVIHQGSYAVMLTAFVLLSAWFEAAGRRWLTVIGILQAVTLVSTWVPPTIFVFGELSVPAIVLGIAAAAALAGWVIQAYRDSGYDEFGDGRIPAAIKNPAPENEEMKSPTPAGTSRRRGLMLALGLASLLPVLACWRSVAQLWWFGDDWDLLDQIAREGFWRWTLQPFAENFVPVFKLLWGGLVFIGAGSYLPLIIAMWLTHAVNTALFARLLLGAGWSRMPVVLAAGIFAVTSANVETLAWSVQWSALLAVTFFLLAANWLQPRLSGPALASGISLLVLALLSALSALTFARGVLTGAAIAGVVILGTRDAPISRAQRTQVILSCLGPAIAVAVTIFFVSAGNHRALGGHGAEMVPFALSYWAAAPLQRLLELGPWELQSVIALGLIKLALVVWVVRQATEKKRSVLLVFLLLDLGNAALLGIGRYHTGLPAANSERYQYAALLCTLPFIALGFQRWLEATPSLRVRRALAAVVVGFFISRTARPWPQAIAPYATDRGQATREVVLRHPSPPAEGAVPGIPFLTTARAKELVARYNLH